MTISGTNTVDQRSIVLIPFPFSDLSSYKVRPALVISNTNFNSKNEDVICCMITSEPTPHLHTIPITKNDIESGNLPLEGKIKTYRIFTISKTKILKTLGKLKWLKSNKVQKELSYLFSLTEN